MARTTKAPEQTRDLILATALRLFVAQGYFATSVHDICKAANLSTGSIYHHFENKEALARALYVDLLSRMSSMVAATCEGHRSAHDQGRAVAELLCKSTIETPELVRFILHARHQEFLPEAPPICSTRPFELMKAIVAHGIDRGEILPMDPTAASLALFGGVIRLIQLALDGVLERPLAEYLDQVWTAGWRGIAS